MTTSNSILNQFLDTFALSPINVNPTCFKNSKNSSCIDLLWKQTFLKLVSLTIIKWSLIWWNITAQKMKLSIKGFFIKCDRSRSFLRIWSHLLKKSLKENFFYCAVHHFTRESPKTSYYRDYRKFDIDCVSSELSRELDSNFCSVKNEDCEELYEFSRFHRALLNLLNIHTPQNF